MKSRTIEKSESKRLKATDGRTHESHRLWTQMQMQGVPIGKIRDRALRDWACGAPLTKEAYAAADRAVASVPGGPEWLRAHPNRQGHYRPYKPSPESTMMVDNGEEIPLSVWEAEQWEAVSWEERLKSL